MVDSSYTMELLHASEICNLSFYSPVKFCNKNNGASGFLRNKLQGSEKALKVQVVTEGVPLVMLRAYLYIHLIPSCTNKEHMYLQNCSGSSFAVPKVSTLFMYSLSICAWRVCLDILVGSQHSKRDSLLILRAFSESWNLFQGKSMSSFCFSQHFTEGTVSELQIR